MLSRNNALSMQAVNISVSEILTNCFPYFVVSTFVSGWTADGAAVASMFEILDNVTG